jgi:hypothetical protein
MWYVDNFYQWEDIDAEIIVRCIILRVWRYGNLEKLIFAHIFVPNFKGIFQPFELEGETRLIPSDVK